MFYKLLKQRNFYRILGNVWPSPLFNFADEWDLNAYHYAREANIVVINVEYVNYSLIIPNVTLQLTVYCIFNKYLNTSLLGFL